jgi:hypothetical protein
MFTNIYHKLEIGSNSRFVYRLLSLLLLASILIIGIITVDDYGVASDERADVLSVYWNYRLIAKDEPNPIQRRYYMTLIPYTGELAYQSVRLVRGEGIDLYFDLDSSSYT